MPPPPFGGQRPVCGSELAFEKEILSPSLERDREPYLERAVWIVMHHRFRKEVKAHAARGEPVRELDVLFAHEALVEASDREDVLTPHRRVRRVEHAPIDGVQTALHAPVLTVEQRRLPFQ